MVRSSWSDSPFDVDFSVIRTAIDMGHSMIDQILNGMQYGTVEVRNLLCEESDYILECKVCRNLFRSFPNFVAHKRVYCPETYEEKMERENAVPKTAEDEAVIVEPEAPEERSQTPSQMKRQNNIAQKVATNQFDGKSMEYQFYTRVAENLEKSKAAKVTNTVTMKAIPTNSHAVVISHSKGDQSAKSTPKGSPKKSGQDNREVVDGSCPTSMVVDDSPLKSKSISNICMRLASKQSVTHTDTTTFVKDAASGQSKRSRKSQPKKSTKDETSFDRTSSNGNGNSLQGMSENKIVSNVLKKNGETEVTSAGLQKKNELGSNLDWMKHCDFKKNLCKKCGKTFERLSNMKRHIVKRHGFKIAGFKCPICSKLYISRRSVSRHLYTNHNATESQVLMHMKRVKQLKAEESGKGSSNRVACSKCLPSKPSGELARSDSVPKAMDLNSENKKSVDKSLVSAAQKKIVEKNMPLGVPQTNVSQDTTSENKKESSPNGVPCRRSRKSMPVSSENKKLEDKSLVSDAAKKITEKSVPVAVPQTNTSQDTTTENQKDSSSNSVSSRRSRKSMPVKSENKNFVDKSSLVSAAPKKVSEKSVSLAVPQTNISQDSANENKEDSFPNTTSVSCRRSRKSMPRKSTEEFVQFNPVTQAADSKDSLAESTEYAAEVCVDKTESGAQQKISEENLDLKISQKSNSQTSLAGSEGTVKQLDEDKSPVHVSAGRKVPVASKSMQKSDSQDWIKFCDLNKLLCKKCNTYCGRTSNLKSHMNKMHGIRVGDFKCPSCSNYYSNRRCVIRHMRSNHGAKEYQVRKYIAMLAKTGHKEFKDSSERSTHKLKGENKNKVTEDSVEMKEEHSVSASKEKLITKSQKKSMLVSVENDPRACNEELVTRTQKEVKSKANPPVATRLSRPMKPGIRKNILRVRRVYNPQFSSNIVSGKKGQSRQFQRQLKRLENSAGFIEGNVYSSSSPARCVVRKEGQTLETDVERTNLDQSRRLQREMKRLENSAGLVENSIYSSSSLAVKKVDLPDKKEMPARSDLDDLRLQRELKRLENSAGLIENNIYSSSSPQVKKVDPPENKEVLTKLDSDSYRRLQREMKRLENSAGLVESNIYSSSSPSVSAKDSSCSPAVSVVTKGEPLKNKTASAEEDSDHNPRLQREMKRLENSAGLLENNIYSSSSLAGSKSSQKVQVNEGAESLAESPRVQRDRKLESTIEKSLKS